MKYYNDYNDYNINLNNNNISYNKIICLNNKYYIDNLCIKNNRAIHNDIVYFNHNSVLNIKERSNQYISGILLNQNIKYGFNKKNYPYYLFKPINNKYPNFLIASNNKYNQNIYVVIQFLKWDVYDKYPIGSIINIIGPIYLYENETTLLLYKYNLIYKKLKFHKDKIQKDLLINQNIINYDYSVFSIDPPNCTDIDDSFSYDIIDNNIHIGVHITDLTHFIQDFNIFYNKLTTSIYYNNKQINMIPNIYAENICSLIQNTKRKCISLIFIFNQNYKIIDYKIKLSNVYVIKNFSYNESMNIINNNIKSYQYLLNLWNFMIKYDNTISNTHILVEKLMIMTNQKIAELLFNYDSDNTILRTHNQLIKNNFDNIQDINLKTYLEKININSALYSYNINNNNKHDGLNILLYTHFTSPIRRYIDIINHLNIKNMIQKKNLISKKHNDLDNINIINKNIKKFTNNLKILKIIDDYNNIHQQNFNAYIIDFNIHYIKLYIDYLDIEYKYKFIFNDLLFIYKITNQYIYLSDYNNNIINYKKNQKIKIQLHIFKNEINLFDKLKIKFII